MSVRFFIKISSLEAASAVTAGTAVSSTAKTPDIGRADAITASERMLAIIRLFFPIMIKTSIKIN